MKQSFKMRLSARLYFIWWASRLMHSLALSPLSLSLSLQFEGSKSFSFRFSSASNPIWRGRKRLKKDASFTLILLLIYCLCQLYIVYWRKEFLNCSDKGNLLILETYQVCFTLLCPAASRPYKHITHPWSNGVFIKPKAEATCTSWETNVPYIFSVMSFFSQNSNVARMLCAHATLNTPPPHTASLFTMLWAPTVLLHQYVICIFRSSLVRFYFVTFLYPFCRGKHFQLHDLFRNVFALN